MIATIVTIILRFKSSYNTNLNNGHFVEFYSFNVVITTIGLFIFFKYEVNYFISKLVQIKLFKNFLMSLSECSFGIYLIHMFILQAYTKLNIHTQNFNPIFWAPIFTTIVFVTCYIIIYCLRKISFFKYIT